FCIAGSANLPVILYTVYWKRFNTSGAVTAILSGLLSALVLVSVSPNVFSPEAGEALFVGNPLFPIENPAIISVPLGFLRSEEHTSELQSRFDLVCRLLLE